MCEPPPSSVTCSPSAEGPTSFVTTWAPQARNNSSSWAGIQRCPTVTKYSFHEFYLFMSPKIRLKRLATRNHPHAYRVLHDEQLDGSPHQVAVTTSSSRLDHQIVQNPHESQVCAEGHDSLGHESQDAVICKIAARPSFNHLSRKSFANCPCDRLREQAYGDATGHFAASPSAERPWSFSRRDVR